MNAPKLELGKAYNAVNSVKELSVYVGEKDEIVFNKETGTFHLCDGITPGGTGKIIDFPYYMRELVDYVVDERIGDMLREVMTPLNEEEEISLCKQIKEGIEALLPPNAFKSLGPVKFDDDPLVNLIRTNGLPPHMSLELQLREILAAQRMQDELKQLEKQYGGKG